MATLQRNRKLISEIKATEGESSIGRRALLLAMLLFTLVVPIAAIAIEPSNLGDSPAAVLSTLSLVVVGPLYALIARAILVRQGRNIVGWLLMMIGVGLTASIPLAWFIPQSAPESANAFLLAVLALNGVSWVLFIFPIFHLLLVFPTGRLLSPRWRPLAALEVLMVSVMVLLAVFSVQLGPQNDAGNYIWLVDNPIGFVPLDFFGEAFWSIWTACLILLVGAGLTALTIRYRRALSVERQQIKWLVFSVAVFVVIFAGSAIQSDFEGGDYFGILLGSSIVGMGLAIGFAMLRYRLYEIDRIISRTVTYAIVVGLLGGAVALVAALVSTQFDSPLVVAATTLAVAAVFNPLRRRVQEWVDRRFNRSRYDAERVMESFARSLRDEIDSGALINGWVGVVSQTMEPFSISVWVKGQ